MSDKTTKQTLQELLDEVAGEKEEELNARELINEAEAFGRDVAIANDAYRKGKNVALDTITTIIKRKIEEYD